MKTTAVISATLLFFAANLSCNKEVTYDEETEQISANSADESVMAAAKAVTYLIPKGGQYSKPNPFKLTSKSQLTFTAVFDNSCIYTTVDPANQYDINKLYGFSDCNSHHLDNSARIGWRWSNDSLRLFGFVHNDGNMLYKEITSAPIGSVINCRITCLTSTYKFEVNGKSVELARHCSGKYSRYKLYPYFGGDETAPHDITIKLTELKN